MLRLNQFGAILLPTSKEYQKGEISSPSSEIIVSTPLYVGGLPNSVNAGNFNNRRLPFNGCLRQFEVASSFQYFSLNLAAPHIRGTSAGVGACYANVEPGVFFNGSAWVQYGERQFSYFLSIFPSIIDQTIRNQAITLMNRLKHN